MVSVGEILIREREKKGLTLKQVEKEIKIRERYLASIEQNNWTIFSSKIYIIGILKNYAKFLDIDQQKIIAFFRRDYEKNEEGSFKKHVSRNYIYPETKKLVIAGITFLVFLFVSYFVFQLTQFLKPPRIEIISPTTTTVKNLDIIPIEGKTEKDAAITIFGERVYQNKEGMFHYDFPIHQGKNELSIEVTGANGKKSIIKKIFTKNK